ncbi:AMSH-like ubiquitin thioesterase 2 isoform X3 [Cajanus cajan]|uniref:AMSH-like ubiquitin thioesterase 2 isoform X3 n=2 Tax=Cajanus cajan TaxID=3821 RepID=UPI00098D95EE|nr:AMSH-like ubiquitin thioesterase 2 isoform X3 [Cajanus cajan]XP_029127479.1 AMSH-like ubiquitin thioesterase 2 isoform X3 [Cajanus cajan]
MEENMDSDHLYQMYKRSNEEQDVSNEKVRNCDTAESSFQSLRINDLDPSGISSFQLGNLSTSCCSLVCKPAVTTDNRYLLLHKVTQSWPSPALCFVETAPQDSQSSHITAFNSGDGSSQSDNESTSSKTIRDVHISMRLMEDFLDLAKENTEKDLETCGILGAYLEKGTLYMTTLIIPKQESASNSCQATNEEEVFKILNERSLYPVGWIHVCLPNSFAMTHPSQSCFMSSVDLHTQYSYQMMIPEAFAIVLAPKDTLSDMSRSCGLFRLTDPEGMDILKNCQETGFHPHKEPDSGNPVYEHCSNVYKNSNLRFEIFDLR